MFDVSMLSDTVPGYQELNAFKRVTLYGQGSKPGVTGLGRDEAREVSSTTANPYARTLDDMLLWDLFMESLLMQGHDGRDLYYRSVRELGQMIMAGV